jgi:hypothetical protein
LDPTIVKLLLTCGANPRIGGEHGERDPELKIPDTYAGRSAIWWARFHGCADVLATVGAHAGQGAKSRGGTHHGKTPLSWRKEREPFR